MLCEGTAFAKVVRLDPEKLRVGTTEGVQLVVKTLGGVWGQSRLEKKYERFERAIFGTIQKPDETHASYLARHEVQYEDLLSMGATLTEMRAYILLRNSGLSSEDKKKIIIDANGELLYDKVTSALQLLGSKFFGEVQQDSDGDLLADLPENAVAFTLEEVRNVSKIQHGRPTERNDPKCGSTSPRPDPLGPNLQTINAESSFFVAHGSSGIVDLGAVIDTDANQVFFKRLDRSIPIVLTERKLYRLDMMDLLTASPHVPKEQGQPAVNAKCDATAFQLAEDQVTMAASGQFDQLAERLRRMSLDNQASSEAVEQVMEMSLEELKECRIDFGKAHLNKKYQDMVGETRYLTWFAETYRHSQKICHMKFLRFIQLHLDQMEGQMHQARSKAKAKAKTVSRPRDHPELPHDPWNPSSDEEIEIPWEPVTNSEEVTHLTERMTEMEGMLQQILGHLNAPSTRPPMA
eukprot:s785_g32.t1